MSWRNVKAVHRTIFDCLNRDFVELAKEYVDGFPDFHDSNTLLIGSDYSGESSKSPYSVYSFLLTTLESWTVFESKRLEVRKFCFSDTRRMSFKGLGDVQRQKALKPLLEAANSLKGLSFTMAVNKKCVSFFPENGPMDLANPDFYMFKKWKKRVLEKAFLITHCISFLVAGLSREGQDILWFTDEGDITANDEYVCDLTSLFAWISSLYLQHDLGHCRVGTSRCDSGENQIEDLLAIPDLVAGAISEQLSLESIKLSNKPTFFFKRSDFTDKTKNISWWLLDAKKHLKKFVCFVDPSVDGKGHLSSFFHFYDR
ncbi:MAG: hypothetical protein ABR969_08875 [Sedimentisphaerales bacterium]|jgi:hypothetical protein